MTLKIKVLEGQVYYKERFFCIFFCFFLSAKF